MGQKQQENYDTKIGTKRVSPKVNRLISRDLRNANLKTVEPDKRQDWW